MLDIQTATTLKDAINGCATKQCRWLYVSLEDVCRMQVIPVGVTNTNDSYTILTLQKEKTTILAMVHLTCDAGVVVNEIYFKDWE